MLPAFFTFTFAIAKLLLSQCYSIFSRYVQQNPNPLANFITRNNIFAGLQNHIHWSKVLTMQLQFYPNTKAISLCLHECMRRTYGNHPFLKPPIDYEHCYSAQKKKKKPKSDFQQITIIHHFISPGLQCRCVIHIYLGYNFWYIYWAT